ELILFIDNKRIKAFIHLHQESSYRPRMNSCTNIASSSYIICAEFHIINEMRFDVDYATTKILRHQRCMFELPLPIIDSNIRRSGPRSLHASRQQAAQRTYWVREHRSCRYRPRCDFDTVQPK